MEAIMVHKWNITIPELTGTQKRRAYVYLPESYKKYPKKSYPVLYMFDGHNLFFDEDATYGKSWGLKDFMDRTKAQLIIAAVECNHDPDHGRLKEYSPYTFFDPDFGRVEGKGKITMDWLVNTFKKQIDTKYRTLPDRDNTMIAGSSMGGLMSLYALLEYNQYFSRAAALSPSIWTSPEHLEALIRKVKLHPDTILYMDYGSEELKNKQAMHMMTKYSRMTSLLMNKGIYVESRIVPWGAHCEASWERQLPHMMNTLLYPERINL